MAPLPRHWYFPWSTYTRTGHGTSAAKHTAGSEGVNFFCLLFFLSLFECVAFMPRRIVLTLLAALQTWDVVGDLSRCIRVLHFPFGYYSKVNLVCRDVILGLCYLNVRICSLLRSLNCFAPLLCPLCSYPLIPSFCSWSSGARCLAFSTHRWK